MKADDSEHMLASRLVCLNTWLFRDDLSNNDVYRVTSIFVRPERTGIS
jgi:hypothetical protein